jgi:hypothetical protein
MDRIVNVTGPAERQSSQTHPIYNNIDAYPSGLAWEPRLAHLVVSVNEFISNLFFLAEENGGNSFFYPDKATQSSLARFEWHLPWRGKAAQIRIGLLWMYP